MTKQIFNAVEAIKLAYVSHTPVVWVVTDYKEVASQVAEQFVCEHFGAFREQVGNIVGEVLLKQFSIKDKTSYTPTVYYKWVSPNDQPANGSSTLMADIESFVSMYEQMMSHTAVQSMSSSDLLAVRQSIVIIASPTLPQSSWLGSYIEVIYINPLTDTEISDIIHNTLADKGLAKIDHTQTERLIVGFRGFSSRQIVQTLNRCILSGHFDGANANWQSISKEVRQMKRQMLEGFRGLKWIDIPEQSLSVSSVDSLGVLNNWLDQKRDLFVDTESSIRQGYDIPNGILITGIPGTGKSMMAKVTAQKLRLPLVALDLGDLQEGLVGASEQHMEQALRLVEAMAPCVLWIDEIEKAFSGSSSATSDGGVMRRMFGKFLTWMQEKSAPCFVFATSNDITKLPSELFRSERFDDRFYSFMPMADECAVIFAQLIAKENCRFEQQNPDVGLPLFEKELENWQVWQQFLDAMSEKMSCVEMEGDEWKNGEIPQCKLFTGADISSLIKRVKFSLIRKFDKSVNYRRQIVFEQTLEELERFMPYGQTNVRDVARCFLNIAANRFCSASESTIVRFEDYNAIKRRMKYEPNRYTGAYNRALYAMVVGAVNIFAAEDEKRG